MLELERTYLLKEIPEGLKDYPHKDVIDIYIPADDDHPHVRIRKQGNNMVIMKKVLVNLNDLSSLEESVIHLTPEEFAALEQVPGKRIHKHRYYVPHQGLTIEVDVFQEKLKGLILADVEFPDEQTKKEFLKPDFCLSEVTQDVTFAGGLLCGKSYEDILPKLESLGYKKLEI